MSDDDKKERKVIIVTSVGSKREPSPGNPVITFVAHDEGDENAKKGYETWGKDLVDLVVSDARLDCEITHKVKGDQLTLRVTQMFDAQGKPIRQQTRRPGGGGYGGGKSPEERVSIENQVRAYIIADLWKADKLPEDSSQVAKLKTWLDRMGESAPAPAPAQTTKAAAKQEPKTPPASTKEQPAAEKGEFANVGQFLTACNKEFGLDRSATLAALEVSDTAEIVDLKAAWQKISDSRRTHAD